MREETAMRFASTTVVALFIFYGSICHAQSPDSISLVCKANAYGQSMVKSFTVDFRTNQVDGKPAKISDSYIRWRTMERDSMRGVEYPVDHELDRLAGTYHSVGLPPGVIAAGPPTTFLCERTTQRKF